MKVNRIIQEGTSIRFESLKGGDVFRYRSTLLPHAAIFIKTGDRAVRLDDGMWSQPSNDLAVVLVNAEVTVTGDKVN